MNFLVLKIKFKESFLCLICGWTNREKVLIGNMKTKNAENGSFRNDIWKQQWWIPPSKAIHMLLKFRTTSKKCQDTTVQCFKFLSISV